MSYAFYIKTESDKNQEAAKHEFKSILTLHQNNSSAHYRLGFIFYKEKNWLRAIRHFDAAICLNLKSDLFELEDDQLVKANLFISYCALQQAHESMEEANILQQDIGELTNYHGVKIEDISRQIKQKLSRTEFILNTNGVQEQVSKKECDELVDHRNPNHLYLYFSDNTIMLYGLNETRISKTYADYLKYLLENGSAESPIKLNRFPLEFDSETNQDLVSPGTVKTNISRLRHVLRVAGFNDILLYKDGYYISGITYQIAYREDQFFHSNLAE